MLELDQDDLLLNKNILQIAYENALKLDLDIVEFRTFSGDYEKFDPLLGGIQNETGKIIYQPELSHFMLNKNGVIQLNDVWIWGKLFKRELVKKTIEKLKEKNFINLRINGNDDRAFMFPLFKQAKSFMRIRDFGHFFYERSNSVSHSLMKTDYQKGLALDYNFNYFYILYILSENSFEDKAYFEYEFSRFSQFGLRQVLPFTVPKAVNLIKMMMDNEYISMKFKVNCVRRFMKIRWIYEALPGYF